MKTIGPAIAMTMHAFRGICAGAETPGTFTESSPTTMCGSKPHSKMIERQNGGGVRPPVRARPQRICALRRERP